MSIETSIATFELQDKITDFFAEYLHVANEAIYNEEFLCPLGLKAAIKRKQVAISLNENIIVAAARFYPRKKNNIISLYQFAVHRDYRKMNSMKTILTYIGHNPIEVLCPVGIKFNQYYKKTGWHLTNSGDSYNTWRYETVF